MDTQNQNAIDGEVMAPEPVPPHLLIELKLDLPSGGWVEFRDPTQLRAKDRKNALGTVADGQNQVATALSMSSAIAVMLVVRYGGIPYAPFHGATYMGFDPQMIDELTMPDYDALVEHVGPAIEFLFPGKSTVDNNKPGSPTLPAGG